MKDKVDKLNKDAAKINREINKMLSEKFGITGLRVSQISFDKTGKCPKGYERQCKYYGKDPVTGEPIIKCKCVKVA
jgi:hypothetical protein